MKSNQYALFFTFLLTAIVVSCGTPPGGQTTPETETTVQGDVFLDQVDALNAKIRIDSLNPDLYNDRALLYLENEAFNEAFKDIRSALELDSTYSGYFVTQADIYLGMGKLQKTVQSLEKAIALDDQNTDAYLKLAEMSIVIRDYKKALSYIDLALQVDELLDKAFMLRGVVFMENGDTTRGIRNFQKAIDVNQDYLEAHIQLGTLFAMKKNDLAIDYFNNALNIEPENLDVQYYLGMYYQESGRYELAIQSYNSILALQPDFYIAHFNIGYIQLVYQREYEASIESFSQVIALNPEYTEAYYNRGFAYELLKDVEHSTRDYQKTLELYPNYEKAIDGLNRISEFVEDQ